MKAIIRHRYGSPAVLRLTIVPKPIPKDDEVLIRVRGSSINQADWLLLHGIPYLIRLVEGLLRPKRKIIGLDFAGEIETVGAKVSGFNPGDAVYGEIAEAHAEYVCVSPEKIAYAPKSLSFEEAAAVPVAAMTALQGLRDVAKVSAGDRVLINGASGGVGTFAVQIAKALGAEVTAVCSTRNLDLVRRIGADHTVDYTREDFTQIGETYAVIFDLVGSASIAACRRVLQPDGVYLSSVGRMKWLLKSLLAKLLPGPRVALLTSMATPEGLKDLADFIEAGAIVPVIDQRYTLGEVPKALWYQGEGHTQGKSVISI